MNQYEILQIEPTVDMYIIRKAYKKLNNSNADAVAAYKYLSTGVNRYIYYGKIQKIQPDLSQIERLVKENNFDDITVIFETLKVRQVLNWYKSKEFYVEFAMRDAILLGQINTVLFFLNVGIPATIELYDVKEDEEEVTESRSRKKHSMIYFAALGGNLEIVQMLGRRGGIGYESKRNDYTGYAMQAAVMNGHVDVVSHFLKQGADANGHCYVGQVIKVFLQLAAEMNYGSMLTTLIAHGGNIEIALNNACCTYSSATNSEKYLQESKHQSCLQLLFDHAVGLDFKSIDFLQGQNVADCNFVGVSIKGNVITKHQLYQIGAVNIEKALCSLNDYKVSVRHQILNDQVNIKIQQLRGSVDQGIVNFTPLWRAAEIGDLNRVKACLALGVDPNQLDKNKTYPLVIASKNGYVDIVRCLLEKSNSNIIFDAIRSLKQSNESQAIKELLYSRLSVDVCDQYDNSPLHLAAELGDAQQVMLFIESGVMIDAKNKKKKTALNSILSQQKIDVMQESVLEILLRYKTNLINADGDMDFWIAWCNEHLVAIKHLLFLINKSDVIDSDTNIISPWYVNLMFDAVKKQKAVAILTYLEEQGADFKYVSSFGETLLHVAAEYTDENALFEFLIQQDVNIHARTVAGQTALHIAATHAHPKGCKLLLQAGADPYQEDFTRCTPFDCTVIAQKKLEATTKNNQLLRRYVETRQTITDGGYHDARPWSGVDQLIKSRITFFADNNQAQTHSSSYHVNFKF